MQNDVIKKTKSVRRFQLAISILVIFCIASYTANTFQKNRSSVLIGDNKIYVEIAKTQLQQQKGLCCREKLDVNRGMLFVYDKPGVYKFWMKDTLIPLDMYWINSDKRIIYIKKNVLPETYPQTFGPNEASKYVLETNAGYADKRGIKVGDTVSF